MATSWDNVSDAIFHHASERPDAPAIVEGRNTLSYGELAPLVAKCSVYLRDIGVNPGDRVGVALTNSADHLILSFGIMRLGAVLVEISTQVAQAEREGLARKFGISTMFTEPDAAPVGGTKSLWIDVGWRSLVATKTGDCRYEGGGKEPYVIGLTSGSTGLSKGVVTTHRQQLHRFYAASEAYRGTGIFSPERPGPLLLTGSVGFTGYFMFLLCQIFAGGPVVVFPTFTWVADLVRAISPWEDAVCPLTPLMCRGLLLYARQHGLMFPAVRAIMVLGQPLFAEEKRKVVERINPNLYDVYGSAGSGFLSTLPPTEMVGKSGSAGRPVSNAEIEIVDRRGNKVLPGAIGHLRVRGPQVSSGFYSDADGSGHERFDDGWYYPGDRAMVDEAGYVYLKGRASDLIVRRGVEILPSEVEAVVASHDSVAEVVVVGRPAAGIGEEVVALVVARGEPKHEELTQHCMGRLAPEKMPGQIVYAKALPKTANGKFNIAEIKALALRHGVKAPITVSAAHLTE